MKNFIVSLVLIFITTPAFAGTWEGQIKSVLKNGGQVLVKLDDGALLNSCTSVYSSYNAGWIDTDSAAKEWWSMILLAYSAKSRVAITGTDCTASGLSLRITDIRLLE